MHADASKQAGRPRDPPASDAHAGIPAGISAAGITECGAIIALSGRRGADATERRRSLRLLKRNPC